MATSVYKSEPSVSRPTIDPLTFLNTKPFNTSSSWGSLQSGDVVGDGIKIRALSVHEDPSAVPQLPMTCFQSDPLVLRLVITPVCAYTSPVNPARSTISLRGVKINCDIIQLVGKAGTVQMTGPFLGYSSMPGPGDSD